MAGNPWKLQFVDSVSATPTLRLDVNDGGSWICRGFNPAPPRLRRSVSSNAMRDGISVASSNYDARVLTLDLMLQTNTQDQSATELQKLARELDRPSNILKYQPDGASKPVFFSLYRSDWADLVDVMTSQESIREFTIELLAEHDAKGLEENFSSTILNDASNASGFEYTTPTILGDIAAPLVLDLDARSNIMPSGTDPTYLWSQSVPSGVTAPLLVKAGTNASLGTLGTDATAVTGAGTSFANADYINVSFATIGMVDRLTNIAPTLANGTYRLMISCKNTVSSSTTTVRVTRTSEFGTVIQTSNTVTIDLLGGRWFDLGLFEVPFGVATDQGISMGTAGKWNVQAARSSGANNLRIDAMIWVPVSMAVASSNTACVFTTNSVTAFSEASATLRVDARSDSIFVGGPEASTLPALDQEIACVFSGALPMVSPGTNHLRLVPGLAGTAPADTTAFTARYNPRYLFVRPSAT